MKKRILTLLLAVGITAVSISSSVAASAVSEAVIESEIDTQDVSGSAENEPEAGSEIVSEIPEEAPDSEEIEIKEEDLTEEEDSEEEEITSGQISEEAAWEIVENKLVISGSGAIPEEAYTALPETARNAEKLVIDEKITSVGASAFAGLTELSSVIFKGKAPELAANAFSENKLTIYYPDVQSGWDKLVAANTNKNIAWVKYCSIDSDDAVIQTHTWDAGTVTKAATVTASGIRTYTCTACKKTKTETIAKLTFSQPVLVSAVNASAGVTVTWKKVANAPGYKVFRKEAGKNWSTVSDVVSGSATSFTDKTAVTGKNYIYTVRCFDPVSKTLCSTYDAKGKTVFYVKQPTVAKASFKEAGNSKVKVTWNKISSATGYYVYRRNDAGKWQKIATITNASTTSYLDANRIYGTAYSYTVRAYVKKGSTIYMSSYKEFKMNLSYTCKYVNGNKLFYSKSTGKQITDVTSLIGTQSSYVIKVNKKMNTVTVYAKDPSKGYVIPVKAFVCSTGKATPLGTFYTQAKYRWRALQHNYYGQWSTRITGSILFHSVPYNKYNNNKSLNVSMYNKLGSTASAGCVRLKSEDAKWIYDNCSLKTKVIVYNSNTSGPLGKPKALKLSSSHTWDPTDPNMKSLCKKNKCHS